MTTQAIVGFIANLLPLYTNGMFDDMRCAISLTDGTIIVPIAPSEDDIEEGWIAIYWQGDRGRKYETQGSLFASQAVLRYVELLGIGQTTEQIAAEREMLANHFTFKTDASLWIEHGEDDSELFHTLRKGVKALGQNFIVNLINHALGLP